MKICYTESIIQSSRYEMDLILRIYKKNHSLLNFKPHYSHELVPLLHFILDFKCKFAFFSFIIINCLIPIPPLD